jgi:hypothetical protein
MPKFNVGDKIKRTGNDYDDVRKGLIYTVRDYSGPTMLRVGEVIGRYDEEYFELVVRADNTFLLSDLVSGKHVVEYRDGGLRLVLNNGWTSTDKYRSNSDIAYDYREDLTHKTLSSMDVVKIHELKSLAVFSDLLRPSNLTLVWERKPEKTPEQLEAESIRLEMEKLTQRLKLLEGK